MDSVLPSIVMIFLTLFAALTLMTTSLSTQESMRRAWQQMSAREQAKLTTQLAALNNTVTTAGTTALVTLRNEGGVALTAFAQWDVFVTYYDGNTPARLRSERLNFTPSIPLSGQWSVMGIYQDAARDQAEVFGTGSFDPSEVIALQVRLSSAVGKTQSLRVRVSTDNATAIQLDARRLPPQLDLNTGARVASGGSLTFLDSMLAASDTDDNASQLLYTIVTPPAHGTLTPSATFTQADLTAKQVRYSNDGAQNDSFSFTITDGKDEIGPFTFTLTANQPLALGTNTGITMATGGTSVISASNLSVTDPDDTPDALVYTVTVPPLQGVLTPPITFTQADLDAGRVSFQHTAAGNDIFTFTISDGQSVIGPFAFFITVN